MCVNLCVCELVGVCVLGVSLCVGVLCMRIGVFLLFSFDCFSHAYNVYVFVCVFFGASVHVCVCFFVCVC